MKERKAWGTCSWGVGIAVINLATLVLCCACLSSPTIAAKGTYEEMTERATAAFYELFNRYPLPEHLEKTEAVKVGGELDPMDYFSFLDCLRMEEGWVLDYVYYFDGLKGYPLLYARRAEAAPFGTYAEYSRDIDWLKYDPEAYLARVLPDGSPEGYVQLCILAVLGRQFYQYWHSAYNDARIMSGAAMIDLIARTHEGPGEFDLGSEAARKARSIPDPSPRVSMETGAAKVALVTFTEWGGFYRRTYSISLAEPRSISLEKNENLVSYNCGVMF